MVENKDNPVISFGAEKVTIIHIYSSIPDRGARWPVEPDFFQRAPGENIVSLNKL